MCLISKVTKLCQCLAISEPGEAEVDLGQQNCREEAESDSHKLMSPHQALSQTGIANIFASLGILDEMYIGAR